MKHFKITILNGVTFKICHHATFKRFKFPRLVQQVANGNENAIYIQQHMTAINFVGYQLEEYRYKV